MFPQSFASIRQFLKFPPSRREIERRNRRREEAERELRVLVHAFSARAQQLMQEIQQQQEQEQQLQEQQQQQQLYNPQQLNEVAPPASYKAISSLPLVSVTADDLFEEVNRECFICLEEQCIGTQACKLPCGHLYHRQCLSEWLYKHCTCPVCRFEVETDDAAYEQQRRKKMKERKLRYRRDELDSKSVHQLRELMDSLDVAATGCVGKRDLVDRLVQSGRITITTGAPALVMTSEEFCAYSTYQLRQLLTSFGMDYSKAEWNVELRELLLIAGRVVLIDTQSSPVTLEANISSHTRLTAVELQALTVAQLDGLTNSFGLSDSGVIDKAGLLGVLVDSDRVPVTEKMLSALSVNELVDFLAAFDISAENCIERDELMSRIRDSDMILFVGETDFTSV